jgi:hypothetical protein
MEYFPVMTDELTEISTIEQLRQFVNHTLCEHEQLELGAFELRERVLVRGGRPCGIYFTMCGPRAVQFTAIWETDRHSVLFYGCSGDRFLRTQLTATHHLQSELVALVEEIA